MTIWHPVDDPNSDLTSHDTFSSGVPYNTFEDYALMTQFIGQTIKAVKDFGL